MSGTVACVGIDKMAAPEETGDAFYGKLLDEEHVQFTNCTILRDGMSAAAAAAVWAQVYTHTLVAWTDHNQNHLTPSRARH